MKLPRGLFVNAPRANCSIYESGRMIYDCLVLSRRFRLDYIEIDEYSRDISNLFDFYAFNYHHVRMSWLDTTCIRRLPGLKLTFVLETLPNDPFVLCPSQDFDVYCALDPTMALSDSRVYGFPRPLEASAGVPPYRETAVPTIGTFGFATIGKGFDHVVEAVNNEFDSAVVRINIPASTFAATRRSLFAKKDYATYLSELCERTAKKGVDVVVTHEYLSKSDLIAWCAANTLNCFLYDRNMPGLSATTDQAIVSGRPLAVSGNQTFRHIHKFITPYPARSLKESIASSVEGVRQMQKEWSPEKFARQFEKVLDDYGVFRDTSPTPRGPEIIHLDTKQPRITLMGRCRRAARKAYYWSNNAIEFLRPAPDRSSLCKFMLSRSEVRRCTAYLKTHGYISHRLTSKDWDLANILSDLSDGNLLDMGSSDSFLLANVIRKGLRGKKVGIDLQRPDNPVDGVQYVIGDLTHTALPDAEFQNITCLSVLEHNVDFAAFAAEASRLLTPGGKVYITFDYWSPKLVPKLRLFGEPWNILDRNDVERLVKVCRAAGLELAEEIDWTPGKPIVDARHHSPDPALAYTFGLVVFRKQAIS